MKKKGFNWVEILMYLVTMLVLVIFIDFVCVTFFEAKPFLAFKTDLAGSSYRYNGAFYHVYYCNEKENEYVRYYKTKDSTFTCPNTISQEEQEAYSFIYKSDVCAEVVEQFYEDDYFKYYFSCSISGSLYLVSNGNETLAVDALKNNFISLSNFIYKLESMDDAPAAVFREFKYTIEVVEDNENDQDELLLVLDSKKDNGNSALNYNLYYYGLEKVNLQKGNTKTILSDYLKDNPELLENLIIYLEYLATRGDVEKSVSYDGGSTLYRSEQYSLLKCNTLAGNHDVYIGDINMTYEDDFCVNYN